MNIDQAKIEEAVVSQAVAALVENFTDPDNEISSEIHKKAEELILKKVNGTLEKRIKAVVDSGLENLIFPQTNGYGEKKKPDRTLREFIVDRVDEVFNEFLNNDGKPTKEDWYTRDPQNRRVVRIIKEAVGNKIQQDIVAAANEIKGKINQQIADFIKIQLNELTAKLK